METRLRFAILLGVASGLLIGGPAADVVAEDPLVNPPSMNARQIGRTAADLGTQYVEQVVKTFAALDALFDAPPEEAVEAARAWQEHCAVPRQNLADFRDTMIKHLGEKEVPEIYASWVAAQTEAWRITAAYGEKGIAYRSMMRDTIKRWRESSIPKVKVKKKDFREKGEKVNKIYIRARGRARTYGDFDEAVKIVKKAVTEAVPMANTLGESLDRLLRHVNRDVEKGDPQGNNGLWTLSLESIAGLKGLPNGMPQEPIWGTRLRRWGEALFQQGKELIEVHAEYAKVTASLRAGTLFRSSPEPLRAMKVYKKIGPTYERLFDELLTRFEEVAKKLAALRRQAEADRKETRRLLDKYGALADREWRLSVARAGEVLEEREAKLRDARRTRDGGDEYTALWRKMVEDKDLPYEEMQKRETPEFKRAWKKQQRESERIYEAEVEALERKQREKQREYAAWQKERDREWDAHDRKLEANAKKWKDLGVPEPLSVYGHVGRDG